MAAVARAWPDRSTGPNWKGSEGASGLDSLRFLLLLRCSAAQQHHTLLADGSRVQGTSDLFSDRKDQPPNHTTHTGTPDPHPSQEPARMIGACWSTPLQEELGWVAEQPVSWPHHSSPRHPHPPHALVQPLTHVLTTPIQPPPPTAKRPSLCLLLALGAAALGPARADKEDRSANMTDAVTHVIHTDMRTRFTVSIVQGKTPALEVDAPADVLDRIATTVSGERLTITSIPGSAPGGETDGKVAVNVKVTLKGTLFGVVVCGFVVGVERAGGPSNPTRHRRGNLKSHTTLHHTTQYARSHCGGHNGTWRHVYHGL